MVDTARSLAALLVLLADNVSEDISPQDVRDMLVSLHPAHGGIAVTTPVETSITDANWTPIAGVWDLNALTDDYFGEAGNGQLQYSGSPPARIATVTGTISPASAVKDREFEFAIAKNGTVLNDSIIGSWFTVATTPRSVTVQALVDMSTNDYVSLMVRGITSTTTNITADYANLQAMAHIT